MSLTVALGHMLFWVPGVSLPPYCSGESGAPWTPATLRRELLVLVDDI